MDMIDKETGNGTVASAETNTANEELHGEFSDVASCSGDIDASANTVSVAYVDNDAGGADERAIKNNPEKEKTNKATIKFSKLPYNVLLRQAISTLTSLSYQELIHIVVQMEVSRSKESRKTPIRKRSKAKNNVDDDKNEEQNLPILPPMVSESSATSKPSIFDQRWDAKFQELVNFKKDYGTLKIGTSYRDSNPSYRSLGRWLYKQQMLMKNGKLVQAKADRLHDLEQMEVTAPSKMAKSQVMKTRKQSSKEKALPPKLGKSDLNWEHFFGQLMQYKSVNGSTGVPHAYKPNPKLGSWCQRQKKLYRTNGLAPDRLERLNSLGFEWDGHLYLKQINDAKWEARFNELEEYKRINGNTNVPANYEPNQKLGKWVHLQRHMINRNNMPEERLERLRSLGFDTNPYFALDTQGLSREDQWERRFCQLLEFKENHGHVDVPQVYSENKALGKWVNWQRQAYDKKKLSQDRHDRLVEVGFRFSKKKWSPEYSGMSKKEIWEYRYNQLIRYKSEHGHSNVSKTNGSEVALGKWVVSQRQHYRKGKLSQERIEKLELLDFNWGVPRGKARDGVVQECTQHLLPI